MATIDFKRLETLSKTYDGVLQVKKTVASIDDLPKTGVSVGDVYMVGEDDPTPYMWNGESFVPFGGVSKKYVDDQLNGYSKKTEVDTRALTHYEEEAFVQDSPVSASAFFAFDNPAGSGNKKLIIRYPVNDKRFDGDVARMCVARAWLVKKSVWDSGSREYVELVSHNVNVKGDEPYIIFIPLNAYTKSIILSQSGEEANDYAEVVIPDDCTVILYGGAVIDPNSGESVEDDGHVVLLAIETLSPVARKSYFDGYTEQKQLPLREMTAEEKRVWLNGRTEEVAATHGFHTFMAYTNPAGSGVKKIHIKISTEKNRLVDADLLVTNSPYFFEPPENNKLFSFEDGTFDVDCIVEDGYTLLISPHCTASEVMFEEATVWDLDATFNIEITEEVEHGRVLREEDVATTKEAKLLGYVENVKAIRSCMDLSTNPGVRAELRAIGVFDKTWFEEYTAYMQNYGPMTIYPGQMTTAKEIDHYLVSEDTVKGGNNFMGLVKGYELYLRTSTYTDDSGTTHFAEFKYLPSIVCIGKTGNQERWICTQLLSSPALHLNHYIKYLAVYDAKPKLTQVAGAEYKPTEA